jgi:transposase
MIIHMIRSKKFTMQQIADAAKCSRRSVSNIHRKLQKFGSARPCLVHAGRPPTFTPLMLDALCEHLAQQPGSYIDDMVTFLWKEFNILPSHSSIQQALSKRGWTKKKLQQKAKEQNPQLRAFYQHKLSHFRSYQLVFVDESGCDKRVGDRLTGWSPLGVTPVQVSKFHRGQRY